MRVRTIYLPLLFCSLSAASETDVEVALEWVLCVADLFLWVKGEDFEAIMARMT